MTTPDLMQNLKDKLAKLRTERIERCRTDGHLYHVHGEANPTSLSCVRCTATWAIGPRTEPTS